MDGRLPAGGETAGCAAVPERGQPITARLESSAAMSSTTPELGAILLALTHATPGAPVVIYTDSKAAIGKVNSFPGLSTRNKLREPNHRLLDNICSKLRQRDGPCRLEWVRGHAGHDLNELADRLANEARLSSTTPGLLIAEPASIQFTLSIGGKSATIYPRSALKAQAKVAYDLCFVASSHGAALPRANI